MIYCPKSKLDVEETRMNRCSCDNCNRNISEDNEYCHKCYDELLEEIQILKDRIDTIERSI